MFGTIQRVAKKSNIALLTVGCLLAAAPAWGEVCTTQSAMVASDRDALAAAATLFSGFVQMGNAEGLHAQTIAEVAKDFNSISYLIGDESPKLKGAHASVEQVYLLDATGNKRNADGSSPDASFFCNLNKTPAEVNFFIPALPPGKYGFAMVRFDGVPKPQRISLLLRQDQSKWLMAGIYPKPLTAAGHDGLWYWTDARKHVTAKESWTAWLEYQMAIYLLQPAGFVQSTHSEKLHTETTAAAPPALSAGISNDTPLVVKAKDGTEYHFTGLAPDDSLGGSSLDVAVHLKVDAIGDQVAARKRNIAAMSAFLGAYPELRKSFHGMWVYADAPGQQNPYATEQAMGEIPQ